MPPRSRQYTTAAVGLLMVVITGCTASGPGPAPTNTPQSTPTATPTVPVPSGEAVARLRGVLLTPADAGPAWAESGEPVPDAVAPCRGEPVAARFPQAVRVGVELRNVDLAVRHGVSVYPDDAAAGAAFDAAAAGMGCGAGTLDGAPARISAAQDLAGHLDADRATGWQVEQADRDVLVVAVQAGQAVLTFHYTAPSGTGIDERPDALGLTRTGVDRLISA